MSEAPNATESIRVIREYLDLYPEVQATNGMSPMTHFWVAARQFVLDYDETPVTAEWFRKHVGHGSLTRVHGGEQLCFFAKSGEVHCDMVMLVERVYEEDSHEMDQKFDDHDVLALLTRGQVRRMCGLLRIPVEG